MAARVMPSALVEAARTEGREAWLATIPGAVAELARRWALRVGEPFEPGGQTAWVAPVSRGDEHLVLKVGWRHPEARDEAAGLRAWRGDGTVLLHDAVDLDAETTALLLERCEPGSTLSSRPEAEQDVVVAGLLQRAWRAPVTGHGFRPLQDMCDQWTARFAAESAPLEEPIVTRGLALFRALPASSGRSALLVTDLHAGNVLSAGREPWLIIDPKPYTGDPTYDVLQHMLNCPTRLHEDPQGLSRRLAGLLDLDADRLLLWLFARCVVESVRWPSLAAIARRLAPGVS